MAPNKIGSTILCDNTFLLWIWYEDAH